MARTLALSLMVIALIFVPLIVRDIRIFTRTRLRSFVFDAVGSSVSLGGLTGVAFLAVIKRPLLKQGDPYLWMLVFACIAIAAVGMAIQVMANYRFFVKEAGTWDVIVRSTTFMQRMTGDVPLAEKSEVSSPSHWRTASLIGVFLTAYGLSAIFLIAANMVRPWYLWTGLMVIFSATAIFGAALVISSRKLGRK